MTKPTSATVNAPHADVMRAIQSCCLSTAQAVNHDRMKDVKLENRCYSDLFKLLFGRKPTHHELEYMTGGLSGGICDKCQAVRTTEFHPDGTLYFNCDCQSPKKGES